MYAPNAAAPSPVRENALVLHVSPAQFDQPIEPAALGADDFIATLVQPGLGAPRALVGTRVDGAAYDRIVLDYFAGDDRYQRTWVKGSESLDTVEYALHADTSSCGYVSLSA